MYTSASIELCPSRQVCALFSSQYTKRAFGHRREDYTSLKKMVKAELVRKLRGRVLVGTQWYRLDNTPSVRAQNRERRQRLIAARAARQRLNATRMAYQRRRNAIQAPRHQLAVDHRQQPRAPQMKNVKITLQNLTSPIIRGINRKLRQRMVNRGIESTDLFLFGTNYALNKMFTVPKPMIDGGHADEMSLDIHHSIRKLFAEPKPMFGFDGGQIGDLRENYLLRKLFDEPKTASPSDIFEKDISIEMKRLFIVNDEAALNDICIRLQNLDINQSGYSTESSNESHEFDDEYAKALLALYANQPSVAQEKYARPSHD